ncbi:hypothetical protein FOG51_00872 [Hanseniaspora uvarum]|nr:hypothetical protein FOG51_00872 [Hanseniaspora uvarum]
MDFLKELDINSTSKKASKTIPNETNSRTDSVSGSPRKHSIINISTEDDDSNFLEKELNRKLDEYINLEQEHVKIRKRRKESINDIKTRSILNENNDNDINNTFNAENYYYNSDLITKPSVYQYYKTKVMKIYLEFCLTVLSYTPWIIKRIFFLIYSIFNNIIRLRFKAKRTYTELVNQLPNLKTYDEYLKFAKSVDNLTGANIWRESFVSSSYDYETVLIMYMMLSNYDMNNKDDITKIKDLLITDGPFMTRNFANIGDVSLYSKSLLGTKKLIEVLLKKCNMILDDLDKHNLVETSYFSTCNLSLGHTALILNGGSLFGLYHLGVFKALFNNNYLPKIISGSSMGACMAAIICCLPIEEVNKVLNEDEYVINKLINEEQELLKECGYGQQDLKFLDDGVDTDLNMTKMITNVIFKGYSKDIFLFYKYVKLRICKKMTFQEAFELTGYKYNIVIYPKEYVITCPTLLNHITTPNVIISSAIDCSLGSEMVPNCKLLCKNFKGEIEDYLITKNFKIEYLSPDRYNDSNSDNNYSKIFAGEKKTAYEKLTELYNVNNFIISLARPYLSSLLVNDLKNEINVSKYYQYSKSYLKNIRRSSQVEEEDLYENFDINTYTRYQKPFISTKWIYQLERKFKSLLAMEFKHRIEVMDDLGILNQWIRKLTVDERIPSNYCDNMTIVPSISDISIFRIIEGRLDNINYWMSVGERSTWHYIPLIKTRCQIEFELDRIIDNRK